MIPDRVCTHVAFHVGAIRRFNEAVRQCQQTGEMFGAPGRYEWEYRLKAEAQADEALTALAQVETLAHANGTPLDELYAHCGGKPEKTPWSAEALTWRRD